MDDAGTRAKQLYCFGCPGVAALTLPLYYSGGVYTGYRGAF